MAGGAERDANAAGLAPAEILQKVPPHSTEAEAALLGGILLDPSRLDQITDVLRVEDFYHKAHREIFNGILDLATRVGEFDALTLSEHLKTAGTLDAVGGSAYVFSLPDQAISAANVPQYAKIVADKSLLRQLVSTAGEIAAKGYDFSGDNVYHLLEQAEQSILDVSRQRARTGFSAMRQIAPESFDLLEKQSQMGEISGVRSGFDALDKLTMGFQPSDLIILAARPAMGKTSFALNVLEHVGIEQQLPVAMFSLEMSRQQLGIRMLCSHARLDQKAVRQGFVRDPWKALAVSASALSESPVFIDDSPVLNLTEIRSRARRLHTEHGLSLLAIDYLQLIHHATGRRTDSREREVAEISRGLKQLAKELNIPIIVLAQLNRQVEQEKDCRPKLSHLRESGALEQDADLVMFLYRKEVYFRDDPEAKGKGEVILAKHRNGPIGAVPLAFLAKYTRFDNLAEDDGYTPPPPKAPGGYEMDDGYDAGGFGSDDDGGDAPF